MQDFQCFDENDPMLSKLLEVDSKLAVQEAELLSQLESLQEKRRSLKTVIDLFSTADIPTTVTAEDLLQIPLVESDRNPAIADTNLGVSQVETLKATNTAESATKPTPYTKSKATQTTAPSTKGNKNMKVTRTTKAAKKALGWQQYIREEFRKTSLPEAVYLVLQRQAEQVFENPMVVNAIFRAQTPEEVRDKVRHQITNILAEGARKNRWYRGQQGCYSISRAAAEANSVS